MRRRKRRKDEAGRPPAVAVFAPQPCKIGVAAACEIRLVCCRRPSCSRKSCHMAMAEPPLPASQVPVTTPAQFPAPAAAPAAAVSPLQAALLRTEERRVGEAGVCECVFRWAPDHLKKK